MFLSLIAYLLFLFIIGSFAYAALSAAPWVPLSKHDIERMIMLSGAKENELVYDLGCGDGRILISVVARRKCRAIGFEVSFLMYLIAQLRVLLSGHGNNIKIKYKNFYTTPFNSADVIFAFLTPYAMSMLKNKVATELHAGARFITYAFPINGLRPKIIKKEAATETSIFLYEAE